MSDSASENEEIQFALDGQAVCAQPGETVLGVAKRLGIEIPTLCHHDAVTPYGACRLCVVEVFWGKRSKLVTSCIYIPYDGDKVDTNSDRVRRTRRLILEMLAARCPTVKLIRDLAREYGVDEPRFDDDGADNAERCILCGLCVRTCDEVVGAHAIGFANRGLERVISTPFADNAEECIGCCACVFVCPTGALHYEDIDGARVFKELRTTVPLQACRCCGRPFATEQQIAKVRDTLTLPDELAETCPACRKSEFQDLMARTLGQQSPVPR